MPVFNDLSKRTSIYGEEILAAVERVVTRGWYLLGEELSSFEREYASYIGTSHCIGVGNGLDALTLIYQGYMELGMLSPGDEVLVPEPSYVSYSPGVVFAGGVPVGVETLEKDDFRLTPECLRKAITPRTKALILPYPNNPTGAVMTRADLEAVSGIIAEHYLFVISDEIYSELVYDGHNHVSFASVPGMYERTITINGFSKAFAMTGWRVGYACGANEIISVMNKIHQYAIMCAPRQGQVAAAAALKSGRENGYEDVLRMRDSYDRRRRLMVNAFRSMGLHCFEPYGAFYAFPSIRATGLSSEEFCAELLKDKSVAAVPGTAFGPGGEGNIRCCYATALDKLNIALDRMSEFVGRLL